MVTPTTPDGVVSTAIGQTTLEKVVSTFSSKITIDGQEQAIVGTTTLTGVVSSLSEVKTLNGIVSSVAKVTTLRGVVSLIGASYMAVEVVTLKNSMGVPTATSTIMPSALFTPTIVALLGSYGHPTATVTTSAPVQPIVVVLTDSAGVPTATLTEYPTYPSSSTSPSPGTPNTDSTVHVYIITYSDYFIGFFLPTIASVLLSIPIRMIDLTAKQFQPFHALTLRGGAPSHSSLCLQTGGVYGIIASVRSLSDGQPLALFTTLLTLCSVFLVPLASESVAIQLHGKCSPARFYGCAMTLGVYTGPARATMALLGIMVLLIVLILFTLRGWQSGVAANPWSIAGVATLSTNSEIRAILSSVQLGEDGRVKRARLMDALGGHIFRLGYFRSEYGDVDYGIKIQHDAERSETAIKTLDEKGAGMVRPHSNGHANIPIPFITLSVVGRLAFLLFISGLLVVILYYNETFDETGFEHFMDSQSFGVKFLFTMVGVGVTFFWSSFFASMATLSPYYLLSRRPQSASRSVLISQPINAFTGLWSAIQRRHGALGVVAATAILSEFMPILLNNVPKGIMQTWLTHLVCTWLAVAILALMWLVVAGTFFLAWPQLPADPTTVAGAMYYVCDSPVLELFEGLGSLAKKDRDLRVMGEGMKFQLAEAVGMSGTKRITVDGHFDDGG
ncbi:hypothetical protein GQ53DRAFT_670227 [Thozetella sp. PMI_491]|nr:hypothetical protein GQ53DRAFT_670227 [Thozetella sp. PMI_491]